MTTTMDFQSAMIKFSKALGSSGAAVKPEAPADLSQNAGHEYQHTSPTRRQSPSRTETSTPRSRTPTRTPATDAGELLAIKQTFDMILSKSLSCSAKSLQIHCIVESVTCMEEGSWDRRPTVEADRYVIVPASTCFQKLVTTALLNLGYPHEVVATAKGSVVINNWKPLPLESISETPTATVGDILGDLTAVAILKIRVLKQRLSAVQEIKDKLFRVLLAQSRGLLNSIGCPIDEITLQQLYSGQAYQDVPEHIKRKFEQWWNSQVASRPPPFSPRHPPSPMTRIDRPPSINQMPVPVHPVLQTVDNQYPTQKTRMRTSFDPELELPKLQRWFSENQHPSRQTIQLYVRELNNLESRRGRKPLDINNVVYWFKNARAAQKRQELRNTSGISCHYSMNGFHSRSHSPINGSMQNDSYLGEQRSLKSPLQMSHSPRGYSVSAMSDNTSNAGSYLEDDSTENQERPDSPEGPLSLTTRRKQSTPKDSTDESLKPLDAIKDAEIKQEPSDLMKVSPKASPIKTSDSESNNHKNHNGADDNNPSDDDESGMEMQCDVDDGDHMAHPFFSVSHSHYNFDRLPFMIPNHVFGQCLPFPGIPTMGVPGQGDSGSPSGLNMSALSGADERRKRNRTFIDPVSEVPVLENWFKMNTHPSHNLILKYTEELNRMPYRQKFPRLESKNVQFWFKNRRAKCKRLKMSINEPGSPSHLNYYHGTERKMS